MALGSSGGLAWDLLQLVVGLALVCALAYLVLRFGLRRIHVGAKDGPVRLIARFPLDPRRSLYLVETGGRRFLVGSAEAGITMLAEIAAEPTQRPAP